MADEQRIELTDLDVIAQYSLAVRTATVDREELIATLQSDLAWLEGLGRSSRRTPAPPPTRTSAASARKAAPAKKPAAARKAATRR